MDLLVQYASAMCVVKPLQCVEDGCEDKVSHRTISEMWYPAIFYKLISKICTVFSNSNVANAYSPMKIKDFQEQTFDGLLQTGIHPCYLSMANGEKMGIRVKPCNYDIPSPWVEISHTLHSAWPPVSQQTLSDISLSSLVYASLFSCLSVLPSHPLSGCSLSQLLSDLNRIVVRAPGAEQTDIPPFLLRQTEKGKKMKERKDCVSVSSLSPPPGKMKIPLV